MSPRRQSPISLEYVLLGFLELKPSHGYELFKQLNHPDGVALVWQIKQSQLYALLERLEGVGLLTSTFVVGESHPMRKQYAITIPGRQAFYAWRRSPVLHEREMRQEFLARLYFAQKGGREVMLELVSDQYNTCLEWLESLHINLGELEPEKQYERTVYQFRISQVEATLVWLDDCRRELG